MKLRETCSFHPDKTVGLNSFMLPTYDQQNRKTPPALNSYMIHLSIHVHVLKYIYVYVFTHVYVP